MNAFHGCPLFYLFQRPASVPCGAQPCLSFPRSHASRPLASLPPPSPSLVPTLCVGMRRYDALRQITMLPKFLVGANSCWRPGACVRLCIANRRRETAPTRTVRCGGRSFFLPPTRYDFECYLPCGCPDKPEPARGGNGTRERPAPSFPRRAWERENEMDERGATCPPLAGAQRGMRPEIGCRTKSRSAFEKSPAIRGYVKYKHKQLPVNAGCCPPCQV